MTVKDVMDTIKSAKECSKFLYQLVNKDHDEYTKDHLIESSVLLDEYVDALARMKVQ